MAFTFWRKEALYIGWTDEHGRQRKQKSPEPHPKKAQRLADDLEREAELVRLGQKRRERPDVRFRQAVTLYLASLPAEYASRPQLDARFKRVLPHLGDEWCRQVTPAKVRRVLSANGDCSPQTREHIRIAIQAVFTFLIDEEKLVQGENPAAVIGKVSVPKRKPRFLELAHIPALLQAVPEQHRMLFVFAVATGARKGEAFGLLREDIHLEQGYATIQRSHERDTTKGGRARVVPLPQWLVPMLREHLRTHTSPHVFPGPDGGQQKRWVALHRIMRAALKEAGIVSGWRVRCVTRGQKLKSCGYAPDTELAEKPGILCPKCKQLSLQVEGVPKPLTFHSLRATFGTWAYAHTRDIRFVQQVLGHADVKTTEERYSHVLNEHLMERANQVRMLPEQGSPAGVEGGNILQLSTTHGSTSGKKGA
jgi:integrase